MYSWVEVYTFFVLHNYYDTNIIFFVFVGLKRKVFAIPQLSPISVVLYSVESWLTNVSVVLFSVDSWLTNVTVVLSSVDS